MRLFPFFSEDALSQERLKAGQIVQAGPTLQLRVGLTTAGPGVSARALPAADSSWLALAPPRMAPPPHGPAPGGAGARSGS